MFNLWKKHKKREGKNDYSTTDLTLEQKEDIVAMRVDGQKPSEIAAEMGIPVKKVAKVLELDRRKQAARGNPAGYYGSDQDPIKDMQLEIKKLELEQKKQEMEWKIEDRKAKRDQDLQAQIGDYVEEDDEDKSPMDVMLQAFMMKMLNPGVAAAPPAAGVTYPQPAAGLAATAPGTPQTQSIEVTEQEIVDLIERYPKQAKELRKAPDSVIKKMIRGYIPQISDNSLELAVAILKKKEIKN